MDNTEKKLINFINKDNINDNNIDTVILPENGELVERVNRKIISEDGRQLLKD